MYLQWQLVGLTNGPLLPTTNWSGSKTGQQKLAPSIIITPWPHIVTGLLHICRSLSPSSKQLPCILLPQWLDELGLHG